MTVAVPVHESRVAPLLDVAREVLVVDVQEGEEVGRSALDLTGLPASLRVDVLSRRGVNTVICAGLCGHLWRLLQMWEIDVVAGVVGDVEQVIRAFCAERLDQPQFRMPGCRRARRRLGWGGGHP